MSMTKLLILADDLSGAADCAIAFAAAGLRTAVSLTAAQAMPHAEVIAVDTDTRRMSPADAARCTSAAWQVYGASACRLYKKIDSTLRGNWAAEVAGLQPLAGLAIVVPAYPATGRTVCDGRVFVRGVPLEETETWQLEHAGRSADLTTMLECAGLTTALLTVAALRGDRQALRETLGAVMCSGTQALVVDAQTDADLRALAEATASLDGAFFWVGSGGLARELALVSDQSTPAPDENAAASQIDRQDGAVLILVGSLSAVSERQCAMLRERAGIAEFVVPPAVLRDAERHPQWPAWQARVAAHLGERTDLLLRIGRDEAFDPAEGAHLSKVLAALVAPSFAHLSGLIATGGETARAMLSAVDIASLQLLSEIEPGVAVARAHGREHLAIVTKAGAFGSEHALYGAYLHLRSVTDSARSGPELSNPAGTSTPSTACNTSPRNSAKTL
ncbi:uncharacterized protein YgbK (DUF1537 family) [Paraburkholderia sp. RAU2J]|nr:uncharacterized protein YgbK (DUF1537 family) [Paraburkholderia sp. RAU2J]